MHVRAVCIGLCLLAMGAANVACIRHMWRARKLQWSKRRFRLVAIHYAMLNIQVRAHGLPDLQNRCCASRRKSDWSRLQLDCNSNTLTLLPLDFGWALDWRRAKHDRDPALADAERNFLVGAQRPAAADGVCMVRHAYHATQGS